MPLCQTDVFGVTRLNYTLQVTEAQRLTRRKEGEGRDGMGKGRWRGVGNERGEVWSGVVDGKDGLGWKG